LHIKMDDDKRALNGENNEPEAREQSRREIADLRAQINELKESEACHDRIVREMRAGERIVNMLDGIAKPICILDDASRFIYANSAIERLFKISHAEITGKVLWEVYPKSKNTLFHNLYQKAAADRMPASFRERHRLSGKWFEVFLYPVRGGMAVLFHDVTRSRQMDELFQLALSMLHTLKENIFLVRDDGRLFHVNDETRDSLGYSNDEIIRMSVFDLVPPACAGGWHDILDRIRQHGSMTFESRLRTRAGREFPVEVYANYLELYNRAYYAISARDITDRKHAERTRAFLASIVQSSDDAIIGLNKHGRISSWNKGAEKVYGYSSGDVIGHMATMLAPPDRQIEILDVIGRINEGEHTMNYETIRQRKDGRVIDVSLTISPIMDTSGAIIGSSAISRDITWRKKGEKNLEKYGLFSENTRDIVLFVRRDGQILEANEAAVKAYGYSYEELLSLNIYKLRASDPGHYVDKQMEIAYNDGILFDAMHRRKDGSDFPVEVSSGGKIIDGQKVLLSVVRDITERKQAEEALQVAKAQAELYVDLMGHDINNMNQIGIGFLELALDTLDLNKGQRELLEKPLKMLHKSSRLIENVRKLQRAREGNVPVSIVSLGEFLENLIRHFDSPTGRHIDINLVQGTECRVIANDLLEDVFNNLIGNAVRHNEGDLAIDIVVDKPAGEENGFCVVAISDNGHGIPDHQKPILFSRAQKEKYQSIGSGLGLHLVKTLVKSYGGDIRVEDRVPGDYGKGAKFVVTLPAVK